MANEPGDKKLLAALASGDTLTFKEVYRQYFYMVRTFIEKNNGNEDDAADIFQETMIVLYENCRDNRLVLTSSLKTYLYSIARNKWLKKLRDKKKLTPLNDFEEYIDVNEEETIDLDPGLVSKMLNEIGEACRKLLIMFYYKNKSMNEICETLNYANADTAKNQKYKCLMRLKKMVKG